MIFNNVVQFSSTTTSVLPLKLVHLRLHHSLHPVEAAMSCDGIQLLCAPHLLCFPSCANAIRRCLRSAGLQRMMDANFTLAKIAHPTQGAI